MRALSLLARFLVSAIFVFSALGKIAGFSATAGMIAGLGWPAPSLFIALAILFELGGGLGLMFGFQVRWATLALILFMLLATFGVHGILLMNATDAMAKQDQIAHICKNFALIGALLKYHVDAMQGRSAA
jgi:putative oxidoreductase